ncbi:MAG: glycine--tRNA ligase [Candidatus Kaiserbacteria bacterium]|nr:glycine--tRNA ligase [Candidatus Kaiserbacteria bacterium]
MVTLEAIMQLAKRRGFVFPSSEIYDGFAGVYDYGPLGVELANNLKNSWWHTMVRTRPDIVGLDSGITMHPKIWEASGHTTGFADPVTTCTKTGKRFRADHLLEDIGVSADERMSIEEFRKVFAEHKQSLKIDGCNPDDLSEPEFQNLLVTSNLGTLGSDEVTYLRGETCQGIYVNFKQVLDTMHLHLPFGIAQVGKAFRNEIAPRQFLFRTREFEQMEMQYFTHGEDSKQHFDTFLQLRLQALKELGINEERLRATPHERLVFYAKAAVDIEYQYPFGWKELEGIHDRGNYDLTQHTEHSGQKLTYFDQDRNEHIIPSIIETSIGVGRLFLAVLCDAYDEETLEDGTERTVLRLQPSIAPMTIAVVPLMRKDGHPEKAKKVYAALAQQYSVYYDETGAIGKRYRRADEIGTPFAVTIDYDTLKDDTVTIRHRDSMQQERVPIPQLIQHLQNTL